MAVNLKGKGFFMWKVASCEGGNPDAIATEAHRAGLSHVLIKIANGIYDYNYDATTKKDLVTPVANALHEKGIQVLGWHYVFGDLPHDEARAAIRQINKIPLDGYVIDAEAEYKGKYSAASTFMYDLRAALPNYPIALSSYRYPKYHSDLPFSDFLKKSDLNMPQVYWEQAHNPGEQLARSLSEFQTIVVPFRPLFPTGAAYASGGWVPTPSEITEFLNKAVSLGMEGANFWSWDYCRAKLPALWDVIADYQWPGIINPEKDVCEKLIDAINQRNTTTLSSLYTSDCAHITAKQTIQSPLKVTEWYSDLWTRIYPNIKFEILSFSGTNPNRHFEWRAVKSDGTTFTGKDTLGLIGGKIVYHFCDLVT